MILDIALGIVLAVFILAILGIVATIAMNIILFLVASLWTMICTLFGKDPW